MSVLKVRPSNKLLTLLFVLHPDSKQVLLGYKKRGFGNGRWNGFGGKVESNESIETAAVRYWTSPDSRALPRPI